MLIRGLGDCNVAERGHGGGRREEFYRSPKSVCFVGHTVIVGLPDSVWLNYVNMREQSADT